MKTLREYIDLIDETQQIDEGLGSAAAGVALAGAMALGQPAKSQDFYVPTPQEQIRAAIQSGDVPRGSRYSAKTHGGWITSVTVDGQTYDIRHRVPANGYRMMAASDQARDAMMREQELEEAELEDPISKIDRLFRDKNS